MEKEEDEDGGLQITQWGVGADKDRWVVSSILQHQLGRSEEEEEKKGSQSPFPRVLVYTSRDNGSKLLSR